MHTNTHEVALLLLLRSFRGAVAVVGFAWCKFSCFNQINENFHKLNLNQMLLRRRHTQRHTQRKRERKRDGNTHTHAQCMYTWERKKHREKMPCWLFLALLAVSLVSLVSRLCRHSSFAVSTVFEDFDCQFAIVSKLKPARAAGERGRGACPGPARSEVLLLVGSVSCLVYF